MTRQPQPSSIDLVGVEYEIQWYANIDINIDMCTDNVVASETNKDLVDMWWLIRYEDI